MNSTSVDYSRRDSIAGILQNRHGNSTRQSRTLLWRPFSKTDTLRRDVTARIIQNQAIRSRFFLSASLSEMSEEQIKVENDHTFPVTCIKRIFSAMATIGKQPSCALEEINVIFSFARHYLMHLKRNFYSVPATHSSARAFKDHLEKSVKDRVQARYARLSRDERHRLVKSIKFIETAICNEMAATTIKQQFLQNYRNLILSTILKEIKRVAQPRPS